MKHVKTFESFLNEASLPFDIEKKLRLNGISFELDEERTEDSDDNRLDFVEVYVGDDKRTGSEWVITVGEGGGFFYIEIAENETVLWSHKYPRGQKNYFDQDCMNSLGFIPEL